MPNCKEGDLAIICRVTSSKSTNLGKIVKVLRVAVEGELFTDNTGKNIRLVGMTPGNLYWVAEGSSLFWNLSSGEEVFLSQRPIHDKFLKPIKPLDDLEGEDEMIKIMKPKEVKHEQVL